MTRLFRNESGAAAIEDPERALSLAYAPASARAALGLLWRVDEQLAQIVATTTTPAIGQMRLTWWHNALEQLHDGPAPAEPLLRALAAQPGIDARLLLPIIDGWEALLDPLPLSDEQVALHGSGRGGALFEAACCLLTGQVDPGVRAAGELWALVDLACRISDATTAARAIARARTIADAVPRAWSRPLRPLGVLAGLARHDSRAEPLRRRPGAPGRVARALRIGLFGI